MSESSMDELQDTQEELITTFLDDMDQVSLPSQFIERVMQQIAIPQTAVTPWTPPQFRLSLMDGLLSAFVTAFIVLFYWLIQQDFSQLSVLLPSFLDEFTPLSVGSDWLYLGVLLVFAELTLLLGVAWFWMEDQPTLLLE